MVELVGVQQSRVMGRHRDQNEEIWAQEARASQVSVMDGTVDRESRGRVRSGC